ncbi:ABC transporter ATP-binding protein [Corynebacterium urealyticum]|uniref:ABC transporter ATP-binding protein n=1 Tax=Corynebacterium urealyticum TaxID=43771 RepID=A0A5D4X977_9CORY|nr:ABC transporter ATP-binding protein [Corynebacterium urealyticum]TYR20743.1 ABC transporter ATP-binding protein [Corynebacterium urealyticum]TYT20445.1 ABC transporter ATP-binding protein [Corynebacterium urealyticum]
MRPHHPADHKRPDPARQLRDGHRPHRAPGCTGGAHVTETLPVASIRDTLRTVRGLLARRRGLITATVALLLTGSASALAIPPVLGWIVDIVLSGVDAWRIPFAAGILVAAGTVSATTAWWGGRLLVVCVQGMLAQLREEVFTAAMRIDATTVERAGSSDVVSRLTGDVEAVTEAGSGVLPRFVGALFTIVLTAVGIAALDPLLALAALIAVPLQLVAVTRFLRRSRPLYVRLRREESDRGQAIIESVAGARTIRAHRLAPARLGLIAERSLTAVDTARTAGRARNVFNGTLNLAEFAGLAAVLTVGFWLVETAGMTVGTVTAAALFFHRLFGPIEALLSSIDDLQRAQAGLERLVGVLHSTAPAAPRQPIRDASVELHHVTFTYPGAGSERPAIADVSIKIAPGMRVVLVGASGSGKSTTARLIAGLAEPDRGAVLVGERPATRAVQDSSKPAVMLVTQETHLFSGTLGDNLRLARADASDDELRTALHAVGAHWVDDLAHGLDTPAPQDLDEQRLQQIALARVLLADPPIVVLDEASAHAGADTTLDRAVDAAVHGRTAIIIAHRLSHAEHADSIAVFEAGRIIEQGDLDDLLARGGVFRSLWEAWTRERDQTSRPQPSPASLEEE